MTTAPFVLSEIPSKERTREITAHEFSSSSGVVDFLYDRATHPHAAVKGVGLSFMPVTFRYAHAINGNVVQVNALSFDIDKAPFGTYARVAQHLASEGYDFEMHPTYSWNHGEKAGTESFRVGISLVAPVVLDSPTRWSALLYPHLAKFLQLDKLYDTSFKDPRRIQFDPSAVPFDAPTRPQPIRHKGTPLDALAVLGSLMTVALPSVVYVPQGSAEFGENDITADSTLR